MIPQTEAEARRCIHGVMVWFGHECGTCMDQHGEFLWDRPVMWREMPEVEAALTAGEFTIINDQYLTVAGMEFHKDEGEWRWPDSPAPEFLAGSPTECSDCETRHDEKEDFTYRGFHFCINCMSALISWFLDGGFKTDPDMYDWMGIDDLVPADDG